MTYRELNIHSQEGLRLYTRDYGDRISALSPVLCLPGLTRNCKDFESISGELQQNRRVLTPDFRGRGRSEYAPHWSDYTPQAEAADMFDLMAATGLHKAICLGTSRGGLVAMLMAAMRPTQIKAVILNDIGPEVNPAGIERIAAYAGKMTAPPTWTEAAIVLRQMNERAFPTLTGDQWHRFAANTFADHRGRPKIDYDAKIGLAMRRGLALTRGRVPTMWPQFRALARIPVLVLRGENSDILTSDIVTRMQEVLPHMTAVTVKDRGHAPLLDEPESVAAITAFCDQVDTLAD